MNIRPSLCLLLAVLGGCASDPAPQEQMQLTQRALDQARALGADESQPDYRLARDRYALAQKNMQEEDFKRARMLAEQAELDARLAEARLLRARSDQQIEALNVRIERLRAQLGALR